MCSHVMGTRIALWPERRMGLNNGHIETVSCHIFLRISAKKIGGASFSVAT